MEIKPMSGGITTTVVPEVVTLVTDVRDSDLVIAAPVITTVVEADEISTSSVSQPVVTAVEGTTITTSVIATQVVTLLTAEQGPAGVDGADATGQRTFAFEWGDATPVPLLTVDAGRMVLACTVSLDVPFDGVGASLSIGDAGDDGSLFDAGMIDTSVVGSFQNSPCLRFGTDTEVLLTITPGTGASTGSGVVSLFLE